MSSFRPIARLATAVLGLAVLGACGEDATRTVVAPEPSEAKGGKKGPPGGGETQAPSLIEYYVYDDAGQTMVHTVLDGATGAIGYQTSVDHFHNGTVDGGEHYEYFETLAPHVDEPASLGDGLVHADIPFEGLRYAGTFFSDLPYLDVDGVGGDPFVFTVLAAREEAGTEAHRFHPDGVVDAGLDLHTESTPSAFAVFQGAPATETVSVQAVTADAVQCETVTIRSGKGKNRTVSEVVQVSVDASATLTGNAWTEFHLYDAASGAVSERETSSSGTRAVWLTLELDAEPGDLYVVVDYVYANPGVYDPAANATASSAPGYSPDPAVPLAVSAPLSCPGG